MRLLFALGFCVIGLSACDAEDVIQVTRDPGNGLKVEKFCIGNVPSNIPGVEEECGLRIGFPMQIGPFQGSIGPIVDPGNFKIKVDGTIKPLSLQTKGSMKVTVYTASGNVIASETFPAYAQNFETMAISNPEDVMDWLNIYAVGTATWDVELMIFDMNEIEGLNTAVATLEYLDQGLAIASTSWIGCNSAGPGPGSGFGGPMVSLCD